MTKWLSLMPALLLSACAHSPAVRPTSATPDGSDVPTFDRAAWLADLTQLESQLGHAYANLGWAVQHRGVDLAALDRKARTDLASARSDREAYEAISRFLGAFGDPHLEAKPGGQPWAAPRLYGVRLRTDGREVRVGKILPGQCAHVAAGDRVLELEGKPPLFWVDHFKGLAHSSNPEQARDKALQMVTASAFGPPDGLRLVVEHEGARAECTVPRFMPPKSGGSSDAPSPPLPPLGAGTSAEEACQRMGAGHGDPPNLDPKAHPGLQPLDGDNAFFASRIRRQQGAPLGWLQIGSFVERRYPKACEAAWEGFRRSLKGTCDPDCQARFFAEQVAPRLLSDVAARLSELQSLHVSGIVVDLSGNGGGTDWATGVAELLSPAPLSCPVAAGVRGPHWADLLAQERAGLSSCPAQALPSTDRLRLSRAISLNAHRLAEAQAPCDWSPLFHGAKKPSCGMLTVGERQLCTPPAAPDGLAGLEDCPLFGARPSVARPQLTVPVFVLVDRLTASAAELVAAVLQDNHAATVVGERTLGAGCGYTNGGIPLTLSRSGLKIAVPDCARFRSDGRNEIDGVLPDRTLGWSAQDFVAWPSFAEKALANEATLFAP